MKYLFCLGLLLLLPGCATVMEAVGGAVDWLTPEKVGDGLKGASRWFAPPVSTIMYVVGAMLGAPAVAVTHRKLKNSPEGKLFGPVRKLKEALDAEKAKSA